MEEPRFTRLDPEEPATQREREQDNETHGNPLSETNRIKLAGTPGYNFR